MIKVTVGKDDVVLKLQGASKFFALKSSITIPAERVKPIWLARMRVSGANFCSAAYTRPKPTLN